MSYLDEQVITGLKEQVESLKRVVIVLEERVEYLEHLVVLIPRPL